MNSFAKIDEQNTVTQIIVLNDKYTLDENNQNSETIGKEFLANLLGGNWVQTSYNNGFRKQYACIGGSYDPVNDVFIEEKPFPSWVLNENFDWQAPVPAPGDNYIWDEDNQQWVEMPEEQE